LEHSALAREVAAAATILLSNKRSILPLAAATRSIAVIGAAGHATPVYRGGGSGQVVPAYVVTPYMGISARARSTNATVTYDEGRDLRQAAEAAAKADVAVVVVGDTSSEGSDRATLALPADQDALIEAVAAVQPQTVVVMATPGATLMPWEDRVAAAIMQLMPGQETGNALADVLFGDVNPSGRLPISIPNKDNEVGFTVDQYPGMKLRANYSEGLLIGYRWYDHHAVQPKFPFGHGLSYSTFQYASLVVMPVGPESWNVSFICSNVGPFAGAEVPQLYLRYPDAAGEPPKVLRRFTNVMILAGQAAEINFTLTSEDLSIWDDTTHALREVKGEFKVAIGTSSRDVRLESALLNAG